MRWETAGVRWLEGTAGVETQGLSLLKLCAESPKDGFIQRRVPATGVVRLEGPSAKRRKMWFH